MRTSGVFFRAFPRFASLGLGLVVRAIVAGGGQSSATENQASAEVASIPKVEELPAQSAPSPVSIPTAALTPARAGTNGLYLNFRGAPLRLVLDYLSDAAGFVINQETEVGGTLEVWSKEPVSKDEAVALLNSALKRNGYGVVRSGRILTILRLDNAPTADLEVVTGNDPAAVEKSDEVVTQIIPVRYATASQLVNNLRLLLPTSASLSVNESANALILVAPKQDIRRVLKIVSALDNSIATVSSLKVFPLHYADAKQLAAVLQQLFSPQSSSQNANSRAQLFNGPGPGGFGPPGFGDAQAGQGSSGSTSGGANTKVTIAADEYSNSLIVSSPPGLLPSISNLVQQIDQPVTDITELRLFKLHNADPSELADQISRLFPDDSKASSDQNQAGFRFGPFPGPMGMGAGDNQSASSDRAKKKSQVLAVADARSASLLVSAPSTYMPTIAAMIEKLDTSPARREIVQVYDLHNADPQDISPVLQDLFNRNNTQRTSTSRNSMTGDNNALNTRETQQQTGSSTTQGGAGTGNSTGPRAGAGTTGF